MKNHKKRIFRFFIFILVLIFAAWIIVKSLWDSNNEKNTWSLVFYMQEDRGLSHEFVSQRFATLSECKDYAGKMEKGDVRLSCAEKNGECLADRYLCGLGCAVDSLMGNVFIEEYICEQKILGSLH